MTVEEFEINLRNNACMYCGHDMMYHGIVSEPRIVMSCPDCPENRCLEPKGL